MVLWCQWITSVLAGTLSHPEEQRFTSGLLEFWFINSHTQMTEFRLQSFSRPPLVFLSLSFSLSVSSLQIPSTTPFSFKSLSAPSMPQDVRAYSNSSTQLVVRWSPPVSPNGNQTYYLVRWQQQPEDRELYQHNYCSKGMVHLLKLCSTTCAAANNHRVSYWCVIAVCSVILVSP